jgi:putative aldouronate transport system permease protein
VKNKIIAVEGTRRLSEKKERKPKRVSKPGSLRHDLQVNRSLYLLAIPVIAYFIIFYYVPMGGLAMAFENFKPQRGIFGSEWVGFKHFIDFFTGPNFLCILRNTLVISLLNLCIAFPLSIVFALLLNEMNCLWAKKVVQTVSYMPYFISIVVLCGLITEFCSTQGVITNFLVAVFGIPRENLLTNPDYFWTINLVSDIWQNLGYSSIIFVAAITSVDRTYYEAAALDGANRLQRVWHVTVPSIMPTIATMLILRCGNLLNVGFEKILLLYNSSIYETADVISSHVQRLGIEQGQYGYATAVGLLNSVVGTILLFLSNYLSKKYTDSSIV